MNAALLIARDRRIDHRLDMLHASVTRGFADVLSTIQALTDQMVKGFAAQHGSIASTSDSRPRVRGSIGSTSDSAEARTRCAVQGGTEGPRHSPLIGHLIPRIDETPLAKRHSRPQYGFARKRRDAKPWRANNA